MFSSIGSNSPSESKIVSAIREDILNYAHQGNKIIIGRGGAYIARHLFNALHVRLTAPLNWRIDFLREKYDMSKEKAKDMVHSMDIKRKAWIEHIAGPNPEPAIYDLTFNRKKFNHEMIVDQIIAALESMDLIVPASAESTIHHN